MIEAYRLMLTSRAVDEKCQRFLAQGEPVPNYHSGVGMEALYAGAGLALEESDYLQFTYRAYATLLAKGVTLDELAGDLLLRNSGTTAGYGGIMHVTAPDRGIVGRNSVFGSRYGIAVGLGHSIKVRRERRAVFSAFGEAEGSRGPLFEALNVACLQKLPILFCAENNGFSISSRTEQLYAGGNMSDLVRGFPMPVASVDGNDVEAVYHAVRSLLGYARAGLGPAYLECRTYRIDAHIPTDEDWRYRTQEEIDEWRKADPIVRFTARLKEEGLLDDAAAERMRR